jgi:hypothetical protein
MLSKTRKTQKRGRVANRATVGSLAAELFFPGHLDTDADRQTFVQKLSHDNRIQPAILQSSRRFLLNSFSERAAMAPLKVMPPCGAGS